MTDDSDDTATVTAGGQWSRSPDALWRSTLDAVVLLSAARSDTDPLVIDGPGVQLWEILEESVTIDQIVEQLSETFDGDREVMAHDISGLLERLRDEGLVSVEP